VRKVLLSTFGSLGDLHPFIALAQRLQAHGHRPLLATLADYRTAVLEAGVEFHPVRPSIAQLLAQQHLDEREFARRVMRDTHFLFHGLIFPYLRAAYADLLPVMQDAALVLTSALAFAARLGAERLAVPQMAVVLQPMMFLSAYDPPCLAEAPWLAPLLRGLGPVGTAPLLRLLQWGLTRAAGPIDDIRRELGLAPLASDPLFRGAYSAHGTLALYSPRLAAPQPDYPPRTLLAGFAFYDGATDGATCLEPQLEHFLASGPAPLVFTLGSFVTRDAGAFFEVSAQVARRLGRRAVLVGALGPGTAAASLRRDDSILACGYAPYSALFARAAAIVHQGGIGTAAQALRAGKPQLIVPFYGDQPDNARRIARLGVARTLAPAHYRTGPAVHALRRLLDETHHSERAAALGREIAQENGAERAAQLVDRVLAGVYRGGTAAQALTSTSDPWR